MKIIAQNTEFKIEFNGSATYFVTDSTGHCWKTFGTERKALNFFNKVSHASGIIG